MHCDGVTHARERSGNRPVRIFEQERDSCWKYRQGCLACQMKHEQQKYLERILVHNCGLQDFLVWEDSPGGCNHITVPGHPLTFS